jgi:hypothetical protein
MVRRLLEVAAMSAYATQPRATQTPLAPGPVAAAPPAPAPAPVTSGGTSAGGARDVGYAQPWTEASAAPAGGGLTPGVIQGDVISIEPDGMGGSRVRFGAGSEQGLPRDRYNLVAAMGTGSETDGCGSTFFTSRNVEVMNNQSVATFASPPDQLGSQRTVSVDLARKGPRLGGRRTDCF